MTIISQIFEHLCTMMKTHSLPSKNLPISSAVRMRFFTVKGNVISSNKFKTIFFGRREMKQADIARSVG